VTEIDEKQTEIKIKDPQLLNKPGELESDKIKDYDTNIDSIIIPSGSTIYQIDSENLEDYLDVPGSDDFYYANINEQLPIGSANGLAFINSGTGSILKLQFVKRLFGGQGGNITQTGRLGEVMRESLEVVQIAAYNYLVKHKNYDKDSFKNNSYHLHAPQGAIPKDGPSAGVALFASLISIIEEKPLVPNLAMTGEISTLGEVIAIGGVREKLTACKNHNITRAILPYSNKKEFEALPEEFKEGFTIYFFTKEGLTISS
jgi:ATP-dependent Lon protease